MLPKSNRNWLGNLEPSEFSTELSLLAWAPYGCTFSPSPTPGSFVLWDAQCKTHSGSFCSIFSPLVFLLAVFKDTMFLFFGCLRFPFLCVIESGRQLIPRQGALQDPLRQTNLGLKWEKALLPEPASQWVPSSQDNQLNAQNKASDDLKASIHLENTSRDPDARVTFQRSRLEGRVLWSFSWNSFMLQRACQEWKREGERVGGCRRQGHHKILDPAGSSVKIPFGFFPLWLMLLLELPIKCR